MPSPLQVGVGIRPHTRFWRGPDKYDYHVNRVMNGGRVSLRCTQHYLQHCKGRASIRQDETQFRQTTRHLHDPDRWKIEERAFRGAIMARCRSGDTTPFKRMYHEVRRSLRIGRQAASRIPVVKLRSSMRRARLSTRPKIPHTLKKFSKILSSSRYRDLTKTLDGLDTIYAGKAGKASSKTFSILFASKRMLKYMGRVKKVLSDGTFDPRPRGIKSSQVWTISTIRRHHVLPLVRVLMRRRTTACYVAVLQKLKEIVPRFSPEEIIADFEGAQQRAWEIVFPSAKKQGCLFHYSKAVGLKAGKLSMKRAIRKSHKLRTIVRCICALPLLPTHQIKEGMCHIIVRCARKNLLDSKLVSLLEYWCRTWLPKIHILSVAGSEDRTTNASESDNRMLQDVVHQKYPNVWDLLDGLIESEDYTFSDYCVLRRSRDASRKRKTSALCNDATISCLTEDLKDGNISVMKFLKGASSAVGKAMEDGLENSRKKRRKT